MTSRTASLFFIPFLWLSVSSVAAADALKITSNPPGATVEIDGVPVGTTPFEKNYPGGYFHRTRTSLGARLEHPLVARLNLTGYATREIPLTDGPMDWIGLNGKNHGEYFLFKADHFHVDLDPIAQTFTGEVTAKTATGRADLAPELSLEEVVRQTKPAVVYLKGFQKAGTGFFVTETGVIATNAHVARGEGSLLTLLPSGEQLEAKIVYIDADLDIALAKVEGANFPHLTLADATTVRQGENVLAIGNPGDAMQFSVTKGIVSAIGKFSNAGPGLWIQTDTPINPGNSGGPLLNGRGEVVGINTQKLIKKNTDGIGFALSATDLLAVLRKFYPNVAMETEPPNQRTKAAPVSSAENASTVVQESTGAGGTSTAATSAPTASAAVADGFGIVSITSDPDGAEIYIDEKFLGNTPANLKLGAGSHSIVLRSSGRADWVRTLEVLKSSKVSLKATLDPAH